VAAVIDTALLAVELVLLIILVVIVAVILTLIATGGRGVPADQAPWVQMAVAVVLLQVIFSWLYSAILQISAWQATIGMRLAGLRVTDLQGRRLSFARATARYVAKRLVILTLVPRLLRARRHRQAAGSARRAGGHTGREAP